MSKIFVCSPLRGDMEQNQKNAERFCRFVIAMGHAPFAPHLLFTRFLDDNIEPERQKGIECGIEFLKVCDELWVFGEKITAGMQQEVEFCQQNNIPIQYIKKNI